MFKLLKKSLSKIYQTYKDGIWAVLLINIYILLAQLLKINVYGFKIIIPTIIVLLLNIIIKLFEGKFGITILKIEFMVLFVLIFVISGFCTLYIVLFSVDKFSQYETLMKVQGIFYISGIFSVVIMPYLNFIICCIILFIAKLLSCCINVYFSISFEYVDKVINFYRIKGMLLCRFFAYCLIVIIYLSVKGVEFYRPLLDFYLGILKFLFDENYTVFRFFKDQIIEICVAFTMCDCIIELIKQIFQNQNEKNMRKI